MSPWGGLGDIPRAQQNALERAGCQCFEIKDVLKPGFQPDYAVLDWFDDWVGCTLLTVLKRCLLIIMMRLKKVQMIYVVDRVARIHGNTPHLFLCLRRLLCKMSQRVVCCCDEGINVIRSQIGERDYALIEEKIRVIMAPPVWIDSAKHPCLGHSYRDEMNATENEFVFLNLGFISPYKNIDYLLDLAKAFLSEGLNAKFVIAGTAESPSYLDHVLERSKSLPNVKIINRYINTYELVDFLRSADAALLVHDTSKAMSSASLVFDAAIGVNVVCSSFAVIKDMPNGLLFQFSSEDRSYLPQELYRAARDAYDEWNNDSNRYYRRAEELSKYALSHWSQDSVARLWKNLFSELETK